MIENTIYIKTEIPLVKLLHRKMSYEGEVLLGVDFKSKVPKYRNIKISSKQTKFSKFPDWYFYINFDETVVFPELVLEIKTLDDFSKIKSHISEVKKLNNEKLDELRKNRWLAIHGIGPKFSEVIKTSNLTFDEWLKNKKIDFGHKKIRTALYGKKSKVSFTEVDFTGNPYL